MLQRSAFPGLRLLCVTTVVALLAACASTGATNNKSSASVNDLYSQLDQASKGYEVALEQSRDGEIQASQQTLAKSLDQLKQAAARCGNTPGCDTQRFFSTFDRLLRLKDGDLSDYPELESGVDASQAALASGNQTGAASLPEAQRSVTLLHGQKLSELIAMNGPVKVALQKWLTQWRPQLIDAWVNYQYMRSQMWPPYEQADLPEALLFGIMTKESGGKVHAVSRSGASGPLQFMYATGMRFGLVNDGGFDLRFDPGASARANAAYMNEQLRIFNNNLEITIAAYNTGEGRMRRLVGDNASVSFYDPAIYNQLPEETRTYVPSVLAAAWLFLHPDSYNLRFPRIHGELGVVTLKRASSLEELTVCLGSTPGMEEGWFRTLRNLNPRLDPEVSQPMGSTIHLPKFLQRTYALRCVDGPWPILANDLHTAVLPGVPDSAPDPVPEKKPVHGVKKYKVRSGDTLVSIVRKLHCSSVQEVAEMNGLTHHTIHVGQALKVPDCR